MNAVSAPEGYDDLFRHYYRYVVRLVQRLGIDDQNKEDVASEILLRFYELDCLSQFDPSRVFEYQGSSRPARFKSFLNAFVVSYVRNHRDKQNRIKGREILSWDLPESELRETSDGGLGYLVDQEEWVAAIEAHLCGIPTRSSRDSCDLPALFISLVGQAKADQFSRGGQVNLAALRAEYLVSSTTLQAWLARLRVGVRQALCQAAELDRVSLGG